MMRFGRGICGALVQAERREWGFSNGLGGYAAGTIAGALTRRYHGLLIVPANAGLSRQLLFTKAEASLDINGQLYALGVNHWQSGHLSPKGQVHIESFRLDGQLPVWIYAVAGIRLEQRYFMPRGENSIWAVYRLLEKPDQYEVSLKLSLWINQRDHHSQMPVNGINPKTETNHKQSLRVIYDDNSQLHIQLNAGELQPERHWMRDLLLPKEQQRGLPAIDNHLAIAQAHLPLTDGNWHGLHVGLTDKTHLDPAAALAQVRQQQSHFQTQAKSFLQKSTNTTTPKWVDTLLLNAQSFLFKRELEDQTSGDSIIAGFPWFSDWGRDTMIALPGLTLATGQRPLARQILETWAQYVDQGMIPNRFPESVDITPEYNSVDASLWYILAWHSYMEAGGEASALTKVFPVLEQIINAYQQGTRYQIHLDDDTGLIHIGEPNSQLTWMDARVQGIAQTPRSGKPVEINALWYNALSTMQAFAQQLGTDPDHYANLAQRAKTGFQQYRRPDGGLYDVLDGPTGHDASIRPNQVFALSLPWPILDNTTAHAVLREVASQLYTSYGLRSLSPQHPAYKGVYTGGVNARDAAYHNGTVWAWLLGHYVLAHFRVRQNKSAALSLLAPIADHLQDAGLGSVSEIFDGDPPHNSSGAPAQAWSVATLLEAWWHIQQTNPITDKDIK